jgi:hypothetical protein
VALAGRAAPLPCSPLLLWIPGYIRASMLSTSSTSPTRCCGPGCRGGCEGAAGSAGQPLSLLLGVAGSSTNPLAQLPASASAAAPATAGCAARRVCNCGWYLAAGAFLSVVGAGVLSGAAGSTTAAAAGRGGGGGGGSGAYRPCRPCLLPLAEAAARCCLPALETVCQPRSPSGDWGSARLEENSRWSGPAAAGTT